MIRMNIESESKRIKGVAVLFENDDDLKDYIIDSLQKSNRIMRAQLSTLTKVEDRKDELVEDKNQMVLDEIIPLV